MGNRNHPHATSNVWRAADLGSTCCGPGSPVRAILRDNVVENTARQQGDDTAQEIIPRETRKIDEFKG